MSSISTSGTVAPRTVDQTMCALAAAAFCLALGLQAFSPGVTDVSWLLVIGERIARGERLYVDILEVNPPASYLLYLPAVWLGRLTPVAAEWYVLAITSLVFLMSAWSVGAILRGTALLPRPAVAAFAAVVAFMLLPGDAFAQREHYAVMLLAPALALIARRMERAGEVSTLIAGLVGVAAGFAVCIKPQFGLALLAPQALAAWRAGSFRPFLHTENWITLLVAVFYGGVVALWFPAFWSDMLPLVTQAYRPQRQPLWILLFSIAPVIGPVVLYLATRPRLLIKAAVPLLASLGFLIAYFEQGKGWPYHYLPAACLCVFVVMCDAARVAANKTPSLSRAFVLVLAALLLIFSIVILHKRDDATRDLEAAVRASAPHPRILTLTGDIALGHPLTRRVGGEWVGATASQWITVNVNRLTQANPAAAQRLAPLAAQDRALFLRGLERAPDALIVDKRGNATFWLAWARQDAETARRLEDYVLKTSGAYADLYVRR